MALGFVRAANETMILPSSFIYRLLGLGFHLSYRQREKQLGIFF